MKRIIITCFIIEMLIFDQSIVLAHTRSRTGGGGRPVTEMGGIEGASDQNRAGYGFLNASSEAESEAFFYEVCPNRGGGSIETGCVPQLSILGARMENMSWESMESSFELLANEKVYEKLALEAAAIGKPIPEIPSCLSGNSRLTSLKTWIESNRNLTNDQIRTQLETVGRALNRGTSTTPQNDELLRDRLTKLRAVKSSTNEIRLGQVFLLDKNLKVQESGRCSGTSTDDKMACLNIRRKRDRMRRAFPLLFAGDSTHDDWDNFDMTSERDPCGRTPRMRYELSLYRMIGADYSGSSLRGDNNCSIRDELSGYPSVDSTSERRTRVRSSACNTHEPTEERRLTCRGYGLASGPIRDQMGVPQLTSTDQTNGNYNGMFERAYVGYMQGSGNGAGGGNGREDRLVRAHSDMDQALSEMKDNYGEKINRDLRNICGDSGSLGRMMIRHPQAVRQAVMDLKDPRAKNAVRQMMCMRPRPEEPYLERWQRTTQSHSCAGVSAVSGNPNAVQVNRPSWGWPYAGTANYVIETKPDGSRQVNVPLKFSPQCDTYMRDLDTPDSLGRANQDGQPVGTPQNGAAAVPFANIGTNLSQAHRTRLIALSDTNGNGTLDPEEFNYFALAGMSCNQQRANARVQIQSWLTSTNLQWSLAGANTTPKVQINIQECCPSNCGSNCPSNCQGTCPSGVKEINVSPCYNADLNSGASNCRNVGNNGSNREAEENYSFAMTNSTAWHEMGHAMGLQDEYVDEFYPAHALGESSVGNSAGDTNHFGHACASTMGDQPGRSSGACESIYRRHLTEIIRPSMLGCLTPPGRGPSDPLE